MNKFDLGLLEQHIANGYLRRQVHKTHPIALYKYSHNAQFAKFWPPEMLHMRGIVLDNEGNVVTRPFEKFFNLVSCQDGVLVDEQGNTAKTNHHHEIYDKLDGSLITVTWYGNELLFTSSGSFYSDQVAMAKEIFEANFYAGRIRTGYTYIFELLHPDNQIVCSYGDRKELVLLAVRDIETGEDFAHDYLVYTGFPVVTRITDPIEAVLAKQDKPDFSNEEGFIIKYANGFRLKIKYSEYVRLHKIFTGISSVDIWEMLKDGKTLDPLLDRVPDELYAWVRDVQKKLKAQYFILQVAVDNMLEDLKQLSGDRKALALAIMKKYPQYSKILFASIDGKANVARENMFKMIKPESWQYWGVQNKEEQVV